MVALIAHAVSAFLLGLMFKVHVVFPLAAFVALEAVVMAVLGVQGAGWFFIMALCITQACYGLGIVARAWIERSAAKREHKLPDSPAPDRAE